MLVVMADHLGMCFGVKDALTTMREIPSPEAVTVFGELVHNPVVVEEMAQRGFHQLDETDRVIPSTQEVLITAHGVSNATRRRLLEQGKVLTDTTCPLVRRVHKAALHYQNLGYCVVVVGRPGHVEVEGLVGDLDDFLVVASPAEVKRWPKARLAVVSQTTIPPDQVQAVHQQIRALHPDKEVVFVDTVCAPTRDRQQAVERLVERVEALVVVGGPRSHNTLQLGRKAETAGIPWWRVSSAQELRWEWFVGLRVVGLTAGTSTTDETVDEVHRTLRSFPNRRIA